MAIEAILQFAGGQHSPAPSAPEALHTSALEWLANGRLHFDDAERLLESGDLGSAEKQLRLLLGNVKTVILQLAEARQ